MKWLLIFLCVVAAVVQVFIGVLASADPEGRGAHVAANLFSCALAALVLAAGLAIYLGVL